MFQLIQPDKEVPDPVLKESFGIHIHFRILSYLYLYNSKYKLHYTEAPEVETRKTNGFYAE